jgi:SPP1 family phage portal protein
MAKIEDVLKNPDIEAVRKELIRKSGVNIAVKYEDCAKQFDVSKHDVMDSTKRQDKPTKEGSVKVSRLPVPFQNLIVERSVAFLVGHPVQLSAKTTNDNQKIIVDMVQSIWDKCKLDYKNKEIARILFSECEVAELWYFTKEYTWWEALKQKLGFGGDLNIRMKVLANSLGDSLYPYFDEKGDMTAFSREYVVIEGEKSVTYFEVYTDTGIIKFMNDGKWSLVSKDKNILGKIPIVYYYQPTPDWHKVQNIIERYEKTISNFPDTNDYFGSPTLILEGKVSGMADKESTGKAVKLEAGAKAYYLTWPQGPESIKVETEIEEKLIYTMTQTPNISFDQMKGIGNIAGSAFDMLFMDPHLKASNNEERIGSGFQRRINILKAAAGKIFVKVEKDVDTISIKPKFEYYLPKDDKGTIDMLVSATGGKAVLSQKRATELNPCVVNADDEYKAIQEEDSASISSQTQGSFNL